jgi:pimeloyl-ACP methyl ester carboxylesterase
VLMIPGFYLAHPAPEVDVFNFAPRARQPILMLSGRYDFIFPEKRSQLPFFDRLGTPVHQKRRVAYDSGHNLPPNEMIRETLDWFDKHLGTVH